MAVLSHVLCWLVLEQFSVMDDCCMTITECRGLICMVVDGYGWLLLVINNYEIYWWLITMITNTTSLIINFIKINDAQFTILSHKTVVYIICCNINLCMSLKFCSSIILWQSKHIHVCTSQSCDAGEVCSWEKLGAVSHPKKPTAGNGKLDQW